jgi:hypothetical protein
MVKSSVAVAKTGSPQEFSAVHSILRALNLWRALSEHYTAATLALSNPCSGLSLSHKRLSTSIPTLRDGINWELSGFNVFLTLAAHTEIVWGLDRRGVHPDMGRNPIAIGVLSPYLTSGTVNFLPGGS